MNHGLSLFPHTSKFETQCIYDTPILIQLWCGLNATYYIVVLFVA